MSTVPSLKVKSEHLDSVLSGMRAANASQLTGEGDSLPTLPGTLASASGPCMLGKCLSCLWSTLCQTCAVHSGCLVILKQIRWNRSWKGLWTQKHSKQISQISLMLSLKDGAIRTGLVRGQVDLTACVSAVGSPRVDWQQQRHHVILLHVCVVLLSFLGWIGSDSATTFRVFCLVVSKCGKCQHLINIMSSPRWQISKGGQLMPTPCHYFVLCMHVQRWSHGWGDAKTFSIFNVCFSATCRKH